MDRRILSEMGESTLCKWAAQVGASTNRASPDRTGWDYLVEFPLVYDSSEGVRLPLDKEPGPIQCLVQVKSTDGQSGRRSIKLSNWVRFVNSPLPCFFLIFEYGGKSNCQQAYLVHVDDEYIYRVLKRLRGLDPNKHSKLHKLTLQLEYDESNRLPSLDGIGLEQSVRKYIGRDLQAYADHKLEMVRTVGYEDGRWALRVVMPQPPVGVDIQEYLVDFSLGLIPCLEVPYLEAKDIRFGIEASVAEQIYDQGAVIEITDRQSVGKGTIIISAPDQRSELRLDTEVYLPHGVDVERKYAKARFAAPLIDFIFWLFPDVGTEPRVESKLELPHPSEVLPLGELYLASEFLLLLNETATQDGYLEFEARFNSEPFGKGQIVVERPPDHLLVERATAIAQAWTIAKYFNVHQDVEVRVAELLHQKARFDIVASGIGSSHMWYRITYWSEDCLFNNGRQVCVPYATDVIIGQYRMAISIAIIGDSVATGQSGDNGYEFEIRSTDVRLCRRHLYDREAPRHSVGDLIQSVIDDYVDSHNIFLLDEIRQHLADS